LQRISVTGAYQRAWGACVSSNVRRISFPVLLLTVFHDRQLFAADAETLGQAATGRIPGRRAF
jgi:hypothetical protein